MADDAQDRRLPASARKIKKAREDGQVARSRDLSHFAAIAGGAALLALFAPELAGWLKRLLADALQFDRRAIETPAVMVEQLAQLALRLLIVVVPLGVLMGAVGIGAGVACGGWNWTFKPLSPKFESFNPIAGFGRLFSKQQLLTTLKACLLALVLGVIGLGYLHAHVAEFADALAMPLPAAFAHAAAALGVGLGLLVLALGAFALVDVPLQRKLLLDRLKMSHQEVKYEHKDAEGSVEVKAKVRARMREIVKRRMLAAVPQADLVVMNPTHYAVALKYDDATMAAPRVVAKGADLLALRIRDLARDAKVPVLQAPPLARALYAHAELDREIPAALFAAVAQVLAHVYQLRAALAGRGAMPGELPELKVPPELDPHAAQ
jgi:flagellar biosynthetic protein FlhB